MAIARVFLKEIDWCRVEVQYVLLGTACSFPRCPTFHAPCTLNADKNTARRVRHIAFLSQFIHAVEHVREEQNIVPDALSRQEVAETRTNLPDLKQWSLDPTADIELQAIISDNAKSSLRLQPRATPNGILYADYSTGHARMYVPQVHRRNVFIALHGQAYGGRHATLRLIKFRYCWPDMDRQINQWTKCCVGLACRKYVRTHHRRYPHN